MFAELKEQYYFEHMDSLVLSTAVGLSCAD